MKLSSREVVQLADRCLASAGLSRGASKANAKSIWWTELHRRCGLETLHSIVENAPPLDPASLSLEDQTSVFSLVDSGEQPCIVSSTAALDLSCSQATQEGIGISYTSMPTADSSVPTIGHTAANAANRGMVSVVLTAYPDRSGAVVAVPGRTRPIVAEAALEWPSTSYTKLSTVVENGLYRQEHSPLVQAFFRRQGASGTAPTDAATLERLLEGATEPDSDRSEDDRGFFTICVDPTHPRISTGVRQVANRFVDERADEFTTVYRPSEIDERNRTMVEKGVEIERDVWERLFEYSNGVFAPDSMGSETGAGPGLER